MSKAAATAGRDAIQLGKRASIRKPVRSSINEEHKEKEDRFQELEFNKNDSFKSRPAMQFARHKESAPNLMLCTFHLRSPRLDLWPSECESRRAAAQSNSSPPGTFIHLLSTFFYIRTLPVIFALLADDAMLLWGQSWIRLWVVVVVVIKLSWRFSMQ